MKNNFFTQEVCVHTFKLLMHKKRVRMVENMFEYMTAQETAEKWNVSLRWVQRLCKEGRIEGVINVNRVWLIPKNVQKPTDKRKRKS